MSAKLHVATPESGMAIEWYYRTEDGREQGPVNSSQLKRLADFGKVQPTTQVRLAQGERWEPAAQVDGLFAAGAAKPAPSATPVSVAPQPAAPMPTYQPAYQAPAYQQPTLVPTVLAPGLEWYCQVGGRMLGPLRVEELRDLARLGRVEPTSLIARGAGGPWYPALQMAAGLGLAWMQHPQPAPGYGQPMIAAMPIAQPVMYAAGYAASEAQEDAPLVAEVSSPRSTRLSDMPRSNPMFLVILGGTLAIAVIGVSVTSFIVSRGGLSLSSSPAAGGHSRAANTNMSNDPIAEPEPLVARDAPVSTTGLNGRPKERGDRFQAFATQAAETKWVPEADPKTQADIASREKRVGELLVEMSVDFVTEPLEADFKQLQSQYRTGNLTPQAYLESLEAVLKVLRRATKGGKS